MKRWFIAAVVVVLIGCEDSGPVPFSGPNLLGGGAKGGTAGSGGGKGGSSGSGGSGGMPSSGCSPSTCGSSSAVSLPGGGSCYCDSQCTSNGDCCGNYSSVCLGSGGFGGAAGFGGSANCPTDVKFNSASCDTCMRSSCCPVLQNCDTGSSCKSVDNCRFDYCTQASDLQACMSSYCMSWGPSAYASWVEYWNCMQNYCSSPCAG